MCKKTFKRTLITTLCTFLLSITFLTIPAEAKYYSATGKISWYLGEGHIGYNGKIITGMDCATKKSVDNPPGGTPIYVTDLSNGAKGTFFKNDVGSLKPGVVLDLTYKGFAVYFGHLDSDGYFNGTYYHY